MISAVEVTMATRAGRRMTAWDRRYQKPEVTSSSACSLRLRQDFGASELMRVPSRASTAGSTTSATVAATIATITPPTPIENRKRCGKSIRPASAAATVAALNSTLLPAVRRVRSRASRPGPWAAISSR